MPQQFEGDVLFLTFAIERGRMLVDAHDQADAVLKVLVGERSPESPPRKSARAEISDGGVGFMSSTSTDIGQFWKRIVDPASDRPTVAAGGADFNLRRDRHAELLLAVPGVSETHAPNRRSLALLKALRRGAIGYRPRACQAGLHIKRLKAACSKSTILVSQGPILCHVFHLFRAQQSHNFSAVLNEKNHLRSEHSTIYKMYGTILFGRQKIVFNRI